MGKKLMALLIVGLVFTLSTPLVCSYKLQTIENPNIMIINKPASQLEITIKGGLGLHVFIKNIGSTDVHVSDMKLNLDGRVKYNTDSGDLDIQAGKTKLVIYPVLGFGATNIQFTIDTVTQTASGKVLFWFVYGVK